MIHYHGLPITPASAAAEVLQGRHAFVSFANPDQIDIAIECCQSFALDNGAFPNMSKGKEIKDWQPVYDWYESVKNIPGCDFLVIPDDIKGDEVSNDKLLNEWPFDQSIGAPVWHMHESIERFYDLCHSWGRVCIGSSREYMDIGTPKWWARIGSAINEVVDENGYPPCKLHGLRMLNPDIFSKLPLSSADSTNIGRNIGIDKSWKGNYMPPDKPWRARVMAARIESVNSLSRWEQMEIHEQEGLF